MDESAIAAAVRVMGSQAKLATVLDLTPPVINQWLKGTRPMPPDRCPAIERATEGCVTCEELRPDVRWQRVPDPEWPHLGGRPCIDVAAPAVAETANGA